MKNKQNTRVYNLIDDINLFEDAMDAIMHWLMYGGTLEQKEVDSYWKTR